MGNRAGYCLIELAAAMGISATIAAAAIPQLLATVDDSRALGAARYISSRLYDTRMEALVRSTNIAMRFGLNGSVYEYTVYQDGNGNGVLARDIRSGADVPIRPAERLPERFGGVDFGALPGLPPVDPSGTAPGSDPIRLGASDMVSFTAAGVCTTGTLYIHGKGSAQYAVVIYGDTGRIRVLKYHSQRAQWRPL